MHQLIPSSLPPFPHTYPPFLPAKSALLRRGRLQQGRRGRRRVVLRLTFSSLVVVVVEQEQHNKEGKKKDAMEDGGGERSLNGDHAAVDDGLRVTSGDFG